MIDLVASHIVFIIPYKFVHGNGSIDFQYLMNHLGS